MYTPAFPGSLVDFGGSHQGHMHTLRLCGKVSASSREESWHGVQLLPSPLQDMVM